jgi:ribosomal protein L3
MDLRIIEHLVQLVWELRLVVYYLVKKMAGQLGNKITTIQKLKVIQIDLEEIF